MKYLIARRIIQLTILFLYFSANYWGWTSIIKGDLSFSMLFDTIPLTDPLLAVQMLVAGATISADLILGLVVVFILYGVIGGRAYCSWVCPVNLVTDLSAYLRRKLGIEKVAKKYQVTKNFRYWFLATMIVLSAIMGVAVFEFISPIGILTRGVIFGIGFGWIFILSIFLFDLFILKNGWCGHICPLGAAYSLIGSKSLIVVEHNSESCTNCGECKNVCPEKQVLNPIIHKKSGYIEGIECSNCGRCIEVCNDNSLKFSLRSYIKGANNEKDAN
jgi:ferredoxin-type protein NapH